MKQRNPLKIAMISPISERVPPKKYGGTERVVYTLTEELIKRGHDITLFATGDSQTSARLISVYPRGLREARIKDPHGQNEWATLHLLTAYMHQEQFDIIHDHNSVAGLPLSQFANTPTVITMHGPVTPYNKRLYEKATKPYLVAISHAQIQHTPSIHTASVIYNGLAMETYPFSKIHKGYLLYVGRISIEKGVHYAIEAAVDLNLPLIIAAKLDDADRVYFRHFVEPRLSSNGLIKWVGEVNETERNKLMSEAMAFLHPVTWREPFGLTLIEAMACGCPIIAFNQGSIPEIIVDGKTGFIVDDIEEMITKISEIPRIDRGECRRHVLKNFNAERMAEAYEELYYKILSNSEN